MTNSLVNTYPKGYIFLHTPDNSMAQKKPLHSVGDQYTE